jgi:hypothetical protein
MRAQKYLTALGLGSLVSAGMVSVNVLFGQSIQVRAQSYLTHSAAWPQQR